jgi:lysophospholipase L1-like esterase
MSGQFTAGYPTGQVRDLRILAIGDSTTAGTPGFRSPLESPPAGAGDVESQYAYWLEQICPDWTVLNRGVNRERIDHIQARFARDLREARPDVVILIAGVNDIYEGRAAADVQRGLDALYRKAEQAGLPLVAGSILPYDTATPDQNARMHAVNGWIRGRAAGGARMAFCDTRAAVALPGCADRLASSPDGLHPSPDGYRLMALALAPIVREIARVR